MNCSENIVYQYTREDAINDGMLVAVDEKISKEAGFKYPVAMTNTVWTQYVEWTAEDNEKQTYQDLQGRLWDVLCMLRFAIKLQSGSSDEIRYKLMVIPRDGKTKRAKNIILKALFHPDDHGNPAITIMLPNED